MTTMEDRTIVALYQNRDESAISETDKKYGPYCRRIALNILSVNEDAEECVSDTYLTAWNKIPPDSPISLKAYLGRIVRNLSIDRFRAAKAKKRAGIEVILSELEECLPSSDTTEMAAEGRIITATIDKWLSTLPPGESTLFIRRYWYGDSVKNLAEANGTTPAKLAQLMLKLRGNLRAYLEENGIYV